MTPSAGQGADGAPSAAWLAGDDGEDLAAQRIAGLVEVEQERGVVVGGGLQRRVRQPGRGVERSPGRTGSGRAVARDTTICVGVVSALSHRPNPSSRAACSSPVRRWMLVVPQAISVRSPPSAVSTPSAMIAVAAGRSGAGTTGLPATVTTVLAPGMARCQRFGARAQRQAVAQPHVQGQPVAAAHRDDDRDRGDRDGRR